MKEFEEIMKTPGISTFVAFERLIRHKQWTTRKIVEKFNELVDKKDWMGCSKGPLLEWCIYLTNLPETKNRS